MKKFILFILMAALLSGCTILPGSSNSGTKEDNEKKYIGKKVLFIDSYHDGHAFSSGIFRGVENVLKDTRVELNAHRMDTERNISEDFKKKASRKTKAIIDSYKPDIVIAYGDNASKYVIEPFYRESDMPFVFCGVDWDASVYGFPLPNVTGIIEVAPVPRLIEYLSEYTKGKRIGFLAGDAFAQRKEADIYKDKFSLEANFRFAKDFSEWKEIFLNMQEEVDMLLVSDTAGIKDWDSAEAVKFVLKNTKIPTGTIYEHAAAFALIGLTKVPEEQGEWAAATALEILNGTSPADILIVENKRGQLIVNLKIADKLGIKIKKALLKNAKTIK